MQLKAVSVMMTRDGLAVMIFLSCCKSCCQLATTAEVLTEELRFVCAWGLQHIAVYSIPVYSRPQPDRALCPSKGWGYRLYLVNVSMSVELSCQAVLDE